jgi:nitroreductase
MNDINNLLKQSILNSQHCQRNWDLNKTIPQEDLETLVMSISQCPSKQNIAYYKCHFITNRSVIENIYNNTDGFTITYNPKVTQTNSQTLANLLVAFEDIPITPRLLHGEIRNDQSLWLQQDETNIPEALKRDKEMAIGIASGYLNLTANMLGYSTGFCACFDPKVIGNILGINNKILLIVGIGFKNNNINRRRHQLDSNFMYPAFNKQPIEVSFAN